MSNVKIFSFDEIQTHIQSEDVSDCVCVSLGDPGMSLPEGIGHYSSYFRLEFYDAHQTLPGQPESEIPTKQAIGEIIAFCKKHIGQELHVHCRAGLGRSPAVAMIYLSLCGLSNEEMIETIMALRPACIPNKLVIEFADELMGTQLSDVNAQIRSGKGYD